MIKKIKIFGTRYFRIKQESIEFNNDFNFCYILSCKKRKNINRFGIMSGFNLKSDWKDFDFRPIQVKGFSNPLVLKNLFNRLRGKKAKFDFYNAIRRDITKSLNKHIENVIKMDMNLICEVNGKGGEGKKKFLTRRILLFLNFDLFTFAYY